MTKSWRRRQKKRRFERTGALVLGRGRVRRSDPPRLLRRLRNGLLVLLVVVTAVALWVLLDGRFYVSRAEVTGTVRVSPDEVFRVSRLSGRHILWVDPAEAEAGILAALPSLASARVSCGLLADCVITVVERHPRMMWADGEQLWGVAADGVVFPAGEVEAGGWLVRGPLPRDEEGRLAEPVRVALAELWASGVEMSPELTYVPARGLVITDRRGWRVIVGQGTGMERRLQVLELLAAKLEARGLTPRFVDIRFYDAPYYSLTNEW